MSIDITPLLAADHEAFRELATDASLGAEFEEFQGPDGVSGLLADPFLHPTQRWIARRDGEPVAFAFTFVLSGWQGRWAMVRIGVIGQSRRQGVGSALLERAIREIRAAQPRCEEICMSAWLPNDEAVVFAARHGFTEARRYWQMERPAVHVNAEAWPAGITSRTFDGSERALADYCNAYNRSFAEQYHGARATTEDCRGILALPQSDPAGLMLAYQDDGCVGYCRNALYAGRGEIALLGVVPEARGRGLGRALLRWGVRWLAPRRERITLLVDGENESAMGLYMSEGFETVRARSSWSLRTASA